MQALRQWILLKIAISTFSAVWVPFYLAGRYLGYDYLSDAMNGFGGMPAVVGFSGVLWIGISIWKSGLSEEEKIWWTLLGGAFLPIALPTYWFFLGLPEQFQSLRRETVNSGEVEEHTT